MSQVYKSPQGTPGAAPVEFLQGNVGPKIGPDGTGTINVPGPGANGIATLLPITTTGTAISNTLQVEGRAFLSPAVVDPSTTVGTRGTFATIQSAITNYAAVWGAGGAQTAIIYIRPGTYTENLVMPASIDIVFIGLSGSDFGPGDENVNPVVIIDGNMTTAAGPGYLAFENIFFQNSAGGATSCVNLVHEPNGIVFKNCNFDFRGVVNGTVILDGTSEGIEALFQDCSIGTLTIKGANQTYASAYNSTFNVINIDGGNFVNLYDCELFNGISFVTTRSTGDCFIVNTGIDGVIDTAGSVTYSNIYSPSVNGTSHSTAGFFSSHVNPVAIQTASGSVYNVTSTAVTYNILPTDQIINCIARAGAITIQFPDLTSSTNAYPGQIYIIKDSAGGAAAHNITIQGQSGATVDGAASVVLSTNYQSLTAYNDGTNWFII